MAFPRQLIYVISQKISEKECRPLAVLYVVNGGMCYEQKKRNLGICVS